MLKGYRLKDVVGVVFMRLFSLAPLDKRKVVFESFRGDSFEDNPRAIYDQMVKIDPDINYYWITSSNNSQSISGAKLVKHGSVSEFYHMATAKVWIDNKRKGIWTRKRKGQYYIQTWHGGGVALKKLELDAKESLPEHYVDTIPHDSEVTDYYLSGCKWNSQNYRDAFDYSGPIIEYGMPRSSVLYMDTTVIKKKVKEFYGIDENTNIVLYAPTFRTKNSLDHYTINYDMLINTLKKRFGGEWVLIMRLHPNIANSVNYETNDYTYNGNKYADITELILACDFFITDYSGLMFDAIEARKKCVLYADDVSEYKKERSTYFKLDELPLSIAENNIQLEKELLEFSDTYYENYDSFMSRLGNFNNKNSALDVAKFVIDLLSK